MTHHYQGLGGDAELYAVQALARIHPNLFNDLYLRNTSQDSYSLFSGVYARCIELLGLRNAALALTIACKMWFFAAAWTLARQLSNGYVAFFAVALLIISVGDYGAYHVFHYAEDWLTARSLAEALVITSLACHFLGLRVMGLLIACAAMCVHPLMALPGLLLLLCLWLPFRLVALGAGASILVALGIALSAVHQPSIAHFFLIMDAPWLEVVRERSQFLFLQLWRAVDWRVNIRPFFSLTISALVSHDPRVRNLCSSAMIVGATGLTVALIASVVGPVSILLQGQAWRWVWVTGFTSVLLLAPTVLAVWRSANCGPVCAILIISAWTIPAVDGSACLACTAILWSLRDRIDARAAMVLRWIAVVLGTLIIAWVIKSSWGAPWSRHSGLDGGLLTLIGRLPALQVVSVVIAGSLAHWIRAYRHPMGLALVCGLLIAACVYIVPGALQDRGTDGRPAKIDEFRDWRAAIPVDANVLVVPSHNSAAFAWFTLERPSYLTVNQSSGVVFSRATALEVRRRSQVLLPLMDPDWRLLTSMNTAPSGEGKASASTRRLTRDQLIRLCSDPRLNMVIASETIDLEPLRHAHPGPWQDWNLYDCRRIHSVAPPA